MAELCPNCGSYFATPTALVVHVQKAHRWEDPDASLALNPASHTPGVMCGLCGQTFATPDRLMLHSLSPHVRSGPFRRPARS